MDGLTGLAGLQTLYIDTPEASPEERYGSPVHPKHAIRGETAQPYSWESQQTPAGSHSIAPFDDLLDDELDGYGSYGILDAGCLEQDPTSERPPWTHAAPWPKDPIGDQSIRPDNVARQLIQNMAIHAMKVGGKRNTHSPTLDPVQDQWAEIWDVEPGNTDLTTVPGQMKSGAAPGGRGHTDRTQSNAKQNAFGFDSSHRHRRFATGSVPGNYMWMRPGGRAMVKSLAGPARPAVGEGSPFQGQDLGLAFGIDGAVLQTNPTEYVAPPEPYVGPAQTGPTTENEAGSYADDYGLAGY